MAAPPATPALKWEKDRILESSLGYRARLSLRPPQKKKPQEQRASGMAQHLKAFAAKLEDLSLIPVYTQ